MQTESSLKNLISVKIALLFHDPPNKMWVSASRRSHEEFAKEIASKALTDTSLWELYENAINNDNLKKVVRQCDRFAASFDRWLLTLYTRVSNYYLVYDRFHNIFDPSLSKDLSEPTNNAAGDFAKHLNNVIKEAENVFKNEAISLYNVLYAVLEQVWYAKGFPPSLADTRVPTHTIFDHLYASASIANIIDENGFSGYLALIDYPGVQRFVSAGRKTSDFWAASWILSSIVWRTGSRFAEKYGFDTILTPTPRMNPFTLKNILAAASKDTDGYDFYTISCESISKKSNFARELCDLSMKVFGFQGLQELDLLLNQPIVPAQMTLLLPRIAASSSKQVADEIMDSFRRSWRELYEIVKKNLDENDVVSRFIKSKLDSLKEVLEEPPSGLRVYVVDINSVYEELKHCITCRDADTCEKLGLSPNFEEIDKIIHNDENILGELVERMLYHVLVSRPRILARDYGYYVIPLPRPFYYYEENKKELTLLTSGISYEIDCSLCGEEPAVARFGKTFREHEFADYDESTMSEIMAVANGGQGVSEDLKDKIKREMKKFFKPGEALGPYCLLKRSIYRAFGRKMRVMSTDDIALRRLSRVVNKNEYSKYFFDQIIKKTIKSEEEQLVLENLLSLEEYAMKDIELNANILGYTLDRFVDVINRKLTQACIEVFERNILWNAVLEIYSISSEAESITREIPGFIEKVPKEVLCSSISIPVSYAIVRGDADDIGKTLQGFITGYGSLEEYLEKYINDIIEDIRKYGEVEGQIKEKVLEDIKHALLNLKNLLVALGLKSVPLSPAWHSAVSLSLMLTAIEDYNVSREFDGMLVFSGGDDILAFYPTQTAITAVWEHRKRFKGDGFKYACRSIPVASSLITGRSFSLRFVNLKDVMSEEVAEASRLLKDVAKKLIWELDGKKIAKDTVVVSDSRVNVTAVIPHRLTATTEKRDRDFETTYSYIHRLTLALLTGILSANTPEDIISFLKGGVAHGVTEDNSLESILINEERKDEINKIMKYIVGRNLRIHTQNIRGEDIRSRLLNNLLGDLHRVTGDIGGEITVNLAHEVYSKLFRILRRHVG